MRLCEPVHALVAKRIRIRDGHFMTIFLDAAIEWLILQSVVPGRERKV